jgi:hypothetical protein
VITTIFQTILKISTIAGVNYFYNNPFYKEINIRLFSGLCFSKIILISVFITSVFCSIYADGPACNTIQAIWSAAPGWGAFTGSHSNAIAEIVLTNGQAFFIDSSNPNAQALLALAMMYFALGTSVCIYWTGDNITLMGK